MEKEDRIYTGELIKRVLLGEMTAGEACRSFPKSEDDSVLSAFCALVHLEADEDLRKDLAYKDEQDDYLLYLSQILEQGDALPQNIIESYKEFYKESVIYPEMTRVNILKRLKKNINL